VNLDGEAPWANVRVGSQHGEAPGAKFELSPGRYQVRVTNPGFPALVCRVTLEANRTTTLTVDIAGGACGSPR
jgi:hypothetical protein